MRLDLTNFDKPAYDALIDRLKAAGFVFTNMEALGNTEEAQRMLYVLNDTTSSQTMGASGSIPGIPLRIFKLECVGRIGTSRPGKWW
jgi:hypothetical protein